MSFTPEQFGAVGDGITDDATAFRDLGVALRANPLAFQRIVFAPNKIYLSSNQDWLSGVLNYEIEGNGSVWTSTDRSLNIAVNNPFHSFDLSDPDNISLAEPFFTGCKIQTTDAGRPEVILTAEGLADAADGFLRHGICLLHSMSQQSGGFPPNAALYEWNEIVDIDLNTGVVTLSQPTLYSHRADNIQDYQSPGLEREGWGPARISSFEGSKGGGAYLYPRYAAYKNVIFRMVSDQSYAVPSGLYVAYQACLFDYTGSTWAGTASGPSMTKRFSFDRCRWIGNPNLEPDKLVGRFSMSDCQLPGLVEATGVHQMEISGCDFSKQGIAAAADHWLIDGCTFRTSHGQAIQQAGAYPGGGGEYKNCTSAVTLDPEEVGPAILGNQLDFTFTVEEIGPGGELVWSYDGPQNKSPSHAFGAGGAVIFTVDGRNAGIVDRAIDYDQAEQKGALIVRLKTPAAVGDVFYAHAARSEVVDAGGNEVRFNSLISMRISGSFYIGDFNRNTKYYHGIENVKITRGFTQSNNISNIMRGWLGQIEINVVKDYTGQVSNGENAIALFGKSPDLGLVEIARIKTKHLGMRIISPCQTIMQSADILNQEALSYFWHNFHICGFTDFSDWPIETAEVYPIISVSIEVRGLEV